MVEIKDKPITFGVILRFPYSSMAIILEFIDEHPDWVIAHSDWATNKMYLHQDIGDTDNDKNK